MSSTREALREWVEDHPVGSALDPDRASRKGAEDFRRWLITRTVIGVLIGLLFVGAAAGLRFATNGSLIAGLRTTAALVVEPSTGNAPLRASVDGSGSTAAWGRTITGYDFDFGDGGRTGVQPEATFVHTYKDPGTYEVTLTVITSTGGPDQTSQIVIVSEPELNDPTARLRVKPRTGPTPLQITARGSTSKPGQDAEIVSFDFDFGDGTTTGPQSKATRKHTYQAAGSYTVTLTVLNSVGQSDQTSKDVKVTDLQVGFPTARLRVSPTAGPAPLRVVATAGTSTAGQGTQISSFTFNFGDGKSSGPQPGATSEHTYETPGPFTVTLTVRNSAGLIDDATESVTVTDPALVEPTAKLQVTPLTGAGAKPLAIEADGSGSLPTDGIATYDFDFGDGSSATGPQTKGVVPHRYKVADTYTVTLTVVDTAGRRDTATQEVTVSPPAPPKPVAQLTVSHFKDPDSNALLWQADGSGSTPKGSIKSWNFDFGDGFVTGPQSSPTKQRQYDEAGTYTVTLNITTFDGQTAKTTRTITIG